MDEFTLRIDLGNDAMQTPRDVAEALRALAERVEQTPDEHADNGKVRDLNGNTVGEWTLA